jgi:hypothetical protein
MIEMLSLSGGGVRGDLRVGDKPTQETRSLVSVEMELHARFHKI